MADAIPSPRKPDRLVTVKPLKAEEIEQLIRKAPDLQSRLLIEMLDELGPRRGELAHLQIKDVQFDGYGAILQLNGKTGIRRRRLYNSVPDLRQHLNNHPKRTEPEAPLLINREGRGWNEMTIYRTVRDLGHEVLGKKIHPHMFRHSRATQDSKDFTDREMMLLFGWKRPDMVSVYSHLSMRDVEQKDLARHGIKKRSDTLRPVMRPIRCPKCDEANAPVSVYCQKCGTILTSPRKGMLEEMIEHPEVAEKFFQHPRIQAALQRFLDRMKELEAIKEK